MYSILDCMERILIYSSLSTLVVVVLYHKFSKCCIINIDGYQIIFIIQVISDGNNLFL